MAWRASSSSSLFIVAYFVLHKQFSGSFPESNSHSLALSSQAEEINILLQTLKLALYQHQL
jgi:hypothetical protein